MESNSIGPELRSIGSDDRGKYYECINHVRVMLNLQEAPMLYSGQLLLVERNSNSGYSALKRTPSRRRQQNATQKQNAANCIFSALGGLDFQFQTKETNKPTSTTANNTSTNTTDSSASTLTNRETSLSEDKGTTTLTGSKFTAPGSIEGSSKEMGWRPKPCFSMGSTSKASDLEPKDIKPTSVISSTSSGNLKKAFPCKSSSIKDASQGLYDNQGNFSASSYKVEAHNEDVSKNGAAGEDFQRCRNKYPIPYNLNEHLDAADDSEDDDKKRPSTVKNVRIDGKSQKTRKMPDSSLQSELFKAQVKCLKIQHSLYKVVVAKLRNLEPKPELTSSDPLSKHVTFDDVQSLLFPLEALVRCCDIQLGLHRGLSVVLEGKTSVHENEREDRGFIDKENVSHMIYEKDELLIESRSLMNCTEFAQSLVCFHLSNPYASDLIYACGDDRISVLLFVTCHYVPHGEGKLISLDGSLIYEGQWNKGKRWGHGKAFIFSGSELSASKKQYGMYEGRWWNNMRHGHGRLVFASCAVYEGEWQYDLMSGVGAMHSPDGSILEGLWDEGEPSGCGMFTWPNGTVEYREYQNGQVVRVLQSPEETKKISPLSEVMRGYSILRLKYQMLEEEKLRLVQGESTSIEEKAHAKYFKENLELVSLQKIKQLRQKFAHMLEERKNCLIEKHRIELEEINERYNDKIKGLEDKIHHIKVELKDKKSDLMCQICFERDRDCILMPCSHLLYCQLCITKLQSDGKPARCPACHGSINNQIICKINV